MYREEKINAAWRNHYHVSNSEAQRCGNMICNKCKEKIEGDYLIQDRTNFILRGNENDECYIFHRKCSEENAAWKKFDKDRLDKISQIKEVKNLIEKYGLSADDLFDIDYHY